MIQSLRPAPAAADILDSVAELYERGLYLQAYEAALAWRPLREWTGGAARTLAGRLAWNLGAPRLGRWLRLRAWREEPSNDEVRYYYVWTKLERRGPYAAWRLLDSLGQPENASAKQADWFALRAYVAATLRDFDAAEDWIGRALDLGRDEPWIHVTNSFVLESQDRYEEACAASREALRLQPWHRPAIQSLGQLLLLMNRDQEALDFLSRAATQIESAGVWMQLAALQIELEDFQAARESLNQLERHSPLMEKETSKWLAGERMAVAYRLGDIEQAIELAKQSENPYHEEIGKRLADPARASGRRVAWPVGFVRQHHVTCAPATLAAISRYWNQPANHLEVAEEICYNGTPHYHERRWAEENGWYAREFTITEASAAELLDRGIPFTLTTTEPSRSHLQAVIGYDGRRGTLLIRDPYLRHSGEALADRLIERYRAFGPRGMALVPVAERERLASLDLPDTAVWDELHALDGALISHQREEAKKICDRLAATAPEHFLTLEARRRLAVYDADPVAMLAAVEALRARFPDEPCLQLIHASCLRSFARREERLQIYEENCRKPGIDPIFLQQYAQELQYDARQFDRSRRLLKRAIEQAPQTAAGYYALAHLHWSERRFDQAFELYRIAACLEDKEEDFARSYFSAGQCLKQTETVLAFLRRRFERFGAKSSLPARTLEYSCRLLDRPSEADLVLEEAIRLRPDDGELLLYAADAKLACSAAHENHADELLQRARDRSPRPLWLRTVARLAWSRGNLTEALDRWQEVLEVQPLAIDAHRAVARLLAETQGRPVALAHLEQFTDRFPHYFPLLELWIDWLRDEPCAQAEPVIRRAVEHSPDNAWARRELGYLLVRNRRFEEAWAETEAACQLEPNSDASHCLRGFLYFEQEKPAEAGDAYRAAIRLNVDNDFAIRGLIGCCATPAERRDALSFVRAELERQVTFGDGLLSFREYARATLEAEEVLALLRQALAARPDLWHAWSACVVQLVGMNRLDEAWDLVREATDRFPLVPKLWLDRADVCRARLDQEGQLEALVTAHQINPSYGQAARTLSDLHARRGDAAQARAVLERAIARDPLDPFNHGCLADLAWRGEDRDQALAAVERAVELHPGYDWAWDRLKEWSTAAGRPQYAADVAHKICRDRPGEARSWIVLARILTEPTDTDERMSALDRALDLNPRAIEAHDMRAFLLAQQRRFDDALDACRPAIWKEHPPIELRWRAAWIESVRGNLDAAIALMQDCVREEPNDWGCWRQLADWCRERQDTAGYLQAAQALERIDPQGETSLGYLGEALLISQRRQEAKAVFARAFALSPGYEFAGLTLLDMQLEDQELSEAAVTAAILEQHADGPRLTARKIQLAVRQNDRDRAAQGLQRLCVTADDSWPLETALSEMDRARWGAEAEEVLRAALESRDTVREVGAFWVRRRLSQPDRTWLRELPRIVECGAAGQRAVNEYVAVLAEAKKARALTWFVLRNRSWLRANTYGWASVGYALLFLGKYRRAAKWMADWRDRESLEPWMLLNVAVALRELGRNQEAAEASRLALQLTPDNFISSHHLWLAADAVLADQFDEAAAHLQAVDRSQLDETTRALDAVIDVMLHVANTPRDDVLQTFREVRRRMNANSRHMRSKARRRFYHRCVRRLSPQFGWRGRLWLLERFVLS